MLVLIRIALRNLLEHKTKSLIIGVIIAVGVLVIIDGNAFLDRAQVGIRQAFTENFTGDMYVYGKAPTPTSILFGQMSMTDDRETPLLPDFNALREYVAGRPEVEQAVGLVSGIAMFAVEDTGEVGADGKSGEKSESSADRGMLGGAVLMGIEPESYRAMFDNVIIVDGKYLEPGGEGILVSKFSVDRMNKNAKLSLKAGDELILRGISSTGFKSRKAKIVGIFEPKSDSEANQYMAYADVNTVRLLSGLTVGGAAEVDIPESTMALIGTDDEDDLFGAEESIAGGSSIGAVERNVVETAAAPREIAAADTGAWQYILVKLKNPAATASVVASLNMYFVRNNIDALAGDWKGAAAPFAQSIDLIRVVLSIVILILAIVAIVIIMNTLVVSVIERTGEIGTMRALGAQKGFVWKMFLIETLCVTFTFGIIGVALSGLSMGIINLIGFKASNSFLTILFGGNVLTMSMSLSSVIGIMVLVAIVSIAAHIYPVMVALRIQPVRAMQTE